MLDDLGSSGGRRLAAASLARQLLQALHVGYIAPLKPQLLQYVCSEQSARAYEAPHMRNKLIPITAIQSLIMFALLSTEIIPTLPLTRQSHSAYEALWQHPSWPFPAAPHLQRDADCLVPQRHFELYASHEQKNS